MRVGGPKLGELLIDPHPNGGGRVGWEGTLASSLEFIQANCNSVSDIFPERHTPLQSL